MKEENSGTRFLELFEKVKVEFNVEKEGEVEPIQAYLPVEWTKASSKAGASFDCL